MLKSVSQNAIPKSTKVFRIYAIKNKNTNLYYLGLTSMNKSMTIDANGNFVENTNWNTKKRLVKYIYDDFCRNYAEATEDQKQNRKIKFHDIGMSLLKDGQENHVLSILPVTYATKDDAELALYQKQLKMKDDGKLMNSTFINPEKEKCIYCGKNIKKVFMDAHIEKYCNQRNAAENYYDDEYLADF